MISELKALETRLRVDFSSAQISSHYFDGGGAMIDVIVHGELFVLEYQPQKHQPPSRAFGVSKVNDAEPFTPGHDEFFERLEDAERHLRVLIVAAQE